MKRVKVENKFETLTKSCVDSNLNGHKEISTPKPKKNIEIPETKLKKIDYEKYGKTKVECEVIEFEIKQN